MLFRSGQLFTRARDFGYSKSPEEALAIWGHDAVLADVVLAIRRTRPDVIFTRFSPTGGDTHGHHTASARLALKALGLTSSDVVIQQVGGSSVRQAALKAG